MRIYRVAWSAVSGIIVIVVAGYLLYHSCAPATDVFNQQTAQRIMKSIDLFESEDVSSQNVTVLTGGLSGTKLYKVVDCDVSYVVRQIANRAAYDQQREVAAQLRASQGNYGPHVYYTDRSKGLIVMQYIADHKKRTVHGLDSEKYRILAQLLKKIHIGPAFSYHASITNDIAHTIRRMTFDGQQQYFTKHLSDQMLAVVNYVSDVQRKYPASCFTHRDLNPNNIILSGDCAYAIDFENAAQDDPYFDLATVGIFNVFDSNAENIYLSEYFGRLPTEQELVKYTALKKAAYLFYGLSLIEKSRYESYSELHSTESYFDVWCKIGSGEYSLNNEEQRRIFGLTLLQEALK